MRVHRDLPHIPSIVSLQELLELDPRFDIEAPEPVEDPNLMVSAEMFALIKPGNERVCVVLRSDGMTYKSISEIIGLSEGQIKNIIYTIRKRIITKYPTKEVLQRARDFQERRNTGKNHISSAKFDKIGT